MAQRGRNRAEPQTTNKSFVFTDSVQPAPTCIFLSHISVDKSTAIKIGDYIRDFGFDIYLDIYDNELQSAAGRGDAIAITRAIEKGISNCTHVFCLVSERTVSSWWVPYEIGYGKKSAKTIATLTLKNTVTIPEFLKINTLLRGTKSLNSYLEEIRKGSLLNEYVFFDELQKSVHSKTNHPLDNYLDWDK